MHSTSVFGLEFLVLEGAEEKARATDHRDKKLLLSDLSLVIRTVRTVSLCDCSHVFLSSSKIRKLRIKSHRRSCLGLSNGLWCESPMKHPVVELEVRAMRKELWKCIRKGEGRECIHTIFIS